MRVAALRDVRRGDQLPGLAAAAAAVTGIVNVCSALTPNVSWRGHLLLEVEPVTALPVFHALALPASAALIVTAFYLAPPQAARPVRGALLPPPARAHSTCSRGWISRRPCLSWLVAGLLWSGREAFYVRHDPIGLRGAVWRVPAIAAGAFALTGAGRLRGRAACRLLGRSSARRPTCCSLTTARSTSATSSRWVPLGCGRARRALAALDRLRGLPPAGGAAESPGRRPAGAPRPSSSAGTAPTRCPSSSSAATRTTSSHRTERAFVGYRDREPACSSSPATRSGPTTRSRISRARSAAFAEVARPRARRRSAPASAAAAVARGRAARRSTSETRRSSTRARSRSRGGRSGRFASRCRGSRPPGTTSQLVDVAELDDGRARGARAGLGPVARRRRGARLLDGDGLAPLRGATATARSSVAARRRRRDPRLPPLRADLRPSGRCRCRRCAATVTRPTA